MKNLLQELGYNDITEADDGNTALPLLQAGSFDVLITDWNMPGMTGIDLLKAVRADAKLAKLPVLMLTALGTLEHRVTRISRDDPPGELFEVPAGYSPIPAANYPVSFPNPYIPLRERWAWPDDIGLGRR